MEYGVIARMVTAVMAIPEPWVLAIDRTQWYVGNTTVNILSLGVVHEGIVFPLVWILLDKAGNANTSGRIDRMEQFHARFPIVEIRCTITDREFVGGQYEQGCHKWGFTLSMSVFDWGMKGKHISV